MRPVAALPVLLMPVVLALGVLAGCGDGGGAETAEMGTIRTAPPETTEPEITAVEPRVEAECPYLTAEEVSRMNGELVARVRIDDTVDPPACFFEGADGAIQVTTTIYEVSSPERAVDLVDQSVPVGESERSDVEGGWTGGRSGGSGGALVALSRGTQVLAVQTTQDQSVKVQRIAELVAPRL